MLELAANCSTLFRQHPFLDRFRVAAASGFTLVEYWWPFSTATPRYRQFAQLADALAEAAVRPVCVNLFAGDLDAGERGVLNDPERTKEFRAGVAAAAELSTLTGCTIFNALYGLNTVEEPAESDRCAMANLEFACEILADVGATVVIEPLCRNPRFALRTPAAAFEVVERLRATGLANVGILADFYQFAGLDLDVAAFICRHWPDIFHVQVADDPGRGAPGTGRLPLLEWLDLLGRCGYEGSVGLEYLPGDEADPFEWIEAWRAAPAGRRGVDRLA